jgi:hypothetical protein
MIVVVLSIVTQPLRKVAFAIVHPFIVRIARTNSQKIPIAGILALDHQLRRAAVAQRKARRVGINSRTTAVAHAETHATVTRHVDAIKPWFLGSHRRTRRVNFEVLFIAIKLHEPHKRGALDHTERHALIAQGDDAQRCRGREAHEVASVDLYFHAAVFVGGDGVALDQRIIQAHAFPILITLALEARFAGDQTDADDPIFHVVVIGVVVVIIEGACGSGD